MGLGAIEGTGDFGLRRQKGERGWMRTGTPQRLLLGLSGELYRGAGQNKEDPVAICIDDQEYSLREFGQMLRLYAGWGMRLVFIPDNGVHEEL